MANLSTDFYNINDFVNEIKKTHTQEVNEDTLLLGSFGYMGSVLSKAIQNSTVMASEFCNESIPTRAKYEKNVIAHALGLGITDINTVPATMEVLLTLVEDDLLKLMKDDTFVFDRESQFFFGDFEYHADYDIKISRVRTLNGKYTYTAKYIIDIDNPVSDIVNPYLTPPAKMNINGVNVIYTKVTLRQVEKSAVYTKILSSNSIEAKTFTFNFDSQMAAFTIDVTEGNTKTHLVPVYEGLSVSGLKYPYVYYTYLNANTIRCKFDRANSYAPRINADIAINIQTSQGEAANFTWKDDNFPQFVFDSERYGYTNLTCEIRPITGESAYGSNKKTIEEIRSIIPKEALARDSITNLKDLENFFNQINTQDSKVYLYKKRDNALDRLYYTYLLMRNSNDVIIPTNTIGIKLPMDSVITDDSIKYTLKKGQIIRYTNGAYGEIIDESEIDTDYTGSRFLYTVPYDITINTQPLYTMYRLSSMNQVRQLDFTFINEYSKHQFIATKIGWNRPYIGDDGTYTLSIAAAQNVIDEDNPIIEFDDDDNIINNKLKCYAVIYDKVTGNPLRWLNAELIGYDRLASIFHFEFTFKTNDIVDTNNRIRLEGDGLYDVGTEIEYYAHVSANTDIQIHFVAEQDESYGLNGLDKIIPNLVGSLSNTYSPINGIDFFYNFSEIINSTVSITRDLDEDGNVIEDNNPYYIVNSVPVVKYDYFSTEDKAEDFFNELIQRKNYIDYAIQILEDIFGIDFKFFNTYGPSNVFTTDGISSMIDRVNLSFTFKLKLRANFDVNIINNIIQDIKRYVENIESIKDLHIPNLITEITTTYSEDIIFFEFVDMNGNGPGVQHLYNMQTDKTKARHVPEFINVNTLEVLENNKLVYKPDINIVIV